MSTLGSLTSKLQEKPNSRERLMFLVAILVFGLAFFKLYVTESRNGIAELQSKVDTALGERKALDAEIALTKQAAEGKSNAKDDASRVQWIGKKESVNRASDDLVKAAQENNVYLVKISLQDFKDKQNYLFRPVSLTLAGSFGDLGRFVEVSERLSSPLVIEHLAIEKNPDSTDYITLRLEGGFYAEK